jgi:hypothetical protein
MTCISLFFKLSFLKLLLYWGTFFVTFTKIIILFYHFYITYMCIHYLSHLSTTKIPKIYILIHSSIILFYSNSWNTFRRSHFSIFIHEYVIFPPYSPSHTLSPTHWHQPKDRNCFTFLFSCFWKKRHFCLYKIAI